MRNVIENLLSKENCYLFASDLIAGVSFRVPPTLRRLQIKMQKPGFLSADNQGKSSCLANSANRRCEGITMAQTRKIMVVVMMVEAIARVLLHNNA